MNLTILITIISSITTLAVGFGGILLRHFLNTKTKNKNMYNWKDILESSRKIQETLNEVVHDTNINRALILMTENGGGRPKIGSKLKSSVVYEAYDYKIQSVKREWQGVVVDPEYVKILLKLLSSDKDFIIIKTSDLVDGSVLKDRYLSDKIIGSIIYRIAEKENSMYYLSLALTERNLTYNDRSVIISKITTIRKIFETNDVF